MVKGESREAHFNTVNEANALKIERKRREGGAIEQAINRY